ncbi:MAG: hypothetical protein OES24_22795 [Acidimicrobiia bacterium]|nr:hypothetical protein [Acidimicrobiia bacterium]
MRFRSHLARPIDPRYRSNRQILIVATLAVVVFTIRAFGDGFGSALLEGLLSGGAVFLTWALTRELDPDEPNAALLAALISAPLVWYLGVPSLLVVAVVLMIGRVLIRSSGRPSTTLDLIGVSLLGIVAGRSAVGWAAALILGFALARDRALPGPAAPGSRIAALSVAAGATAMAVQFSEPGRTSLTVLYWVVLLAGVLAGSFTVPYHPATLGDYSGEPLSPVRKQSARRAVLAAAVLAVVVRGGEGVVTMLPVWASFVAVLLVGRGWLPVKTGPDSASDLP